MPVFHFPARLLQAVPVEEPSAPCVRSRDLRRDGLLAFLLQQKR